MMMDERVQYGIDNFLQEDFFFRLVSHIAWKKRMNPEEANFQWR